MPKPRTVYGQSLGAWWSGGQCSGVVRNVPTLSTLTGFEFRTYKGVVAGLNGNRVFDQGAIQGGCGFVGTGRPNLGSGAQLAMSSNSSHLRWNISTFGGSNPYAVVSCYIRVDSATGSPIVFHVDSGELSGRFDVLYNSSTGVITLSKSAEATQDSTVTVGLGTLFRLDLLVDYSCSVLADQWTVDWQIDGLAQPQLVSATGKSATNVFYVGVSDPSSKTAVMVFDDCVVSHDPNDYPLGSHSINLLSPDAELDTATVTGPMTDWQSFLNNGATFEDWHPRHTERLALPADAGSALNGIVKIAASSDYMQVPMKSYTLGAGESVSGARLLIYGWAQDTNPANIEIRLWNGTDEVVLHALADPNFDNSTGDLVCVCRMIPVQYIDTQTKLDNLAVRWGWSTDVTPKIGVAGIGIELSVYTPTAPGVQFLQSRAPAMSYLR